MRSLGILFRWIGVLIVFGFLAFLVISYFGLTNIQVNAARSRAAEAHGQSITLESGLHVADRDQARELLHNKIVTVVGKEVVLTRHERPLYARYVLETADGERYSIGAYSLKGKMYFDRHLDTIVIGDQVTVTFPANLTIPEFMTRAVKRK